MKTTITVQSIHNGTKMKLTFANEQAKQSWIEINGHNYVLKGFSIKKNLTPHDNTNHC